MTADLDKELEKLRQTLVDALDSKERIGGEVTRLLGECDRLQRSLSTMAIERPLTVTLQGERFRRQEIERQRDAHRAVLNRIADRLGVVHEDDKIEDAINEILTMRSQIRDVIGETSSDEPAITRIAEILQPRTRP